MKRFSRRKIVGSSVATAAAATFALVLPGVARANSTYVVSEDCIRCKYMDCVEVCPVDAFYEGENMLVINPVECIDCGLCEPECPIGAIAPGTHFPSDDWLELNRKYSEIWPNIVKKGEPPADAEEWKNVPGKLEFFSPEPGNSVK